MKLKIDPTTISTKELHQHILGSVAPRPIAFVSTVDSEGNPNLAPYSFFNAFSSNPPILVFSSNRRVDNNKTKDTLHNIRATDELVINVVNYNIVRQMALTSVAFDSGTSEFEKSGLTPTTADLVKPFLVEESPVNMECKVKDIITLGYEGGAGHLIICEVLKMHIDENVLDEEEKIDPHKIDLMGRMGRAFYTRASGSSIMKIFQAVTKIPIGYDGLPKHIRTSKLLTANDVAKLGGLLHMPKVEDIESWKNDQPEIQTLIEAKDSVRLFAYAKELLDKEETESALKLLMSIA